MTNRISLVYEGWRRLNAGFTCNSLCIDITAYLGVREIGDRSSIKHGTVQFRDRSLYLLHHKDCWDHPISLGIEFLQK